MTNNVLDELFPAQAGANPSVLKGALLSDGPAGISAEDALWVDDMTGIKVSEANSKALTKLVGFYQLVIAGFTGMTLEAKRAAVALALHAKISHKTPPSFDEEAPLDASALEGAVVTDSQAPAKKVVKKKGGKAVIDDPIQAIAHTVENLNEPTAKTYIATLSDNRASNDFELGGVFNMILSHCWYAPYPSFKKWCEAESPIGYRKASYLIGIYNAILGSGISWEQVSALGWSKLRVLSKYLTTENVDALVVWAEGKSFAQIEEEAEAKWGKGSKNGEEVVASTVKTKTFKLHDDQYEVVDKALSAAMNEKGTQHPSVALDAICTSYLSAATPKIKTTKATVISFMKLLGAEESAVLYSNAFPEYGIEIKDPETLAEEAAAKQAAE